MESIEKGKGLMFAKVFAQILDSSLAEDYRVRFVFEDFLKLADKNGVVDMTPQSIARRTNVPLKIIKLGIVELEKPDTTSRTPINEGRRITRLDSHRAWGWQIVNFAKYRESATKEMLRMSEADRKREYRKKFPRSPSKQTQTAEGEAEQSGFVPDKSRTSPDDRWFPEGFRSAEFKKRFWEWEDHLRERGKPLTPAARKCVLGECAERREPDALAAITFSLGKNTTYIAWDWKKDTETRKNGTTTNQPTTRNDNANRGVSYANRPKRPPSATPSDFTGNGGGDVPTVL